MTAPDQNLSTAINYILITVMLPFVLNWLRQHAAAAKADAANANISLKQKLLDALKQFLDESAANVIDQKLPDFANKLATGQIVTSSQVVNELNGWINAMKNEALDYFKNQNIDLISNLGETIINQVVQASASKIAPVPGSEIERVVKPVLDAVNVTDTSYCKACIPPCDTCPLKVNMAAKGSRPWQNLWKHS